MKEFGPPGAVPGATLGSANALLDKGISSRTLKHYGLGEILSFLTADITTAWILLCD